MIRISRGPIPQGLKVAAPRRLRAAKEAFNNYGVQSDQLRDSFKGYGSKATKQALYSNQSEKCAWCERRSDFSSHPVEHYRPKGGAKRHLRGSTPESVDPAHYWWLTWDWNNLLFSCVRCNDAAHKADYFPLEAGSPTVPAPVAPVVVDGTAALPSTQSELPALLDPAGQDDPLDSLEWIPVNSSQAKRDWIWQIVGRDPRGSATAATLLLGELAEDVRMHSRQALLPSVEEIEQHLASGRLPEAKARWDQLIADVLAPNATLSGFAFQALGHLLPRGRRQAAGLQDPPRPGARRS